MICNSTFGGEFFEPWGINKVRSNIFFINKPDLDPNPDPKLNAKSESGSEEKNRIHNTDLWDSFTDHLNFQ